MYSLCIIGSTYMWEHLRVSYHCGLHVHNIDIKKSMSPQNDISRGHLLENWVNECICRSQLTRVYIDFAISVFIFIIDGLPIKSLQQLKCTVCSVIFNYVFVLPGKLIIALLRVYGWYFHCDIIQHVCNAILHRLLEIASHFWWIEL